MAVHAPVTGPVTVAIRPEEIVLTRGDACRQGTANHLPGRVTAIDSEGPLVRVVLDCGFPLVALIRRLSYLEIGLEAGRSRLRRVRPQRSSPDTARTIFERFIFGFLI